MHEVGLMQEAMRIAMDHVRAAGATRIHSITLRVGAIAGAECEPLQLAFEVVSEGTVAVGAELRLEEVPVQCWCAGCARSFQPPGLVFRCPECRQPSSDVRQGREFDLVAVEVS